MEFLIAIVLALSLFAIGKVTLPSDPEAGLKRLLELRGQQDLSEDEQSELDALENRLKEAFTRERSDGGMTDEDLDKFLDRYIAKSEKEEPKEEKREIHNPGSDIEVIGDRVSDWERRTVRYFNGLATMKDDSVEGRQMISSLIRDVKKMQPRQVADENKEAIRVVKDAGLNRVQQSRVFYGLDLQTRLHTTSTSDTPKAGHLLPKPFLAEVFVIIEQYGLARRLLRGIPMSSKDLDLKNVSTKVVASWISEGNRITADDLVFAEGQLTAAKLAGLTSWTTELSEDEAIALLPIVSELFGESISEEEDKAAFLGDGTATYGSNTGIINLTGVQQYDMGAGLTSASDLTEAHLRAAKNQLSEARQKGAKWVMHRTVWDHITQLENTAGFRIVQENLTSQAPRQLLGLPVELSEVMPTLTGTGAGKTFIILGDTTRSLMGMRRGMTADISREAVIADATGSVTFNAFQMDGALLRLTERVGFKTPSAYEDAFATIATAAT